MTQLTKPRILKRMLLAALAVLLIIIVVSAVRLGLLLHSVGSYRQFWQTTASATPASNAITYIALGDSAAQSIGASSPLKGYVGLVADAVAAKTGRPVHIVNISVTGATVKDVIDVQIPQLKELKITPDTVLTLDIGGNDIVHKTDLQTLKNQYETLLGALPKQTVVGDIPSFSRTRMPGSEPGVIALNKVLHQVAAENNTKLAPLNTTTGQDKSWLTAAADLFHPSNRGYRNWFQGYWAILSKT